VTLAVALGATATSVSAFSSTQANAGTDRTANGTGKTLARFKGGIGVQAVSTVTSQGLAVANIVRGVQPASPWVIADFNATVKADGHITARGKGLVFAGGPAVGTALAINPNTGVATASIRVLATLICENIAPFVQRNTSQPGVLLAADGDFTIDDMLKPAPPANACATPVLLIRNAGNGLWFSAGIQQNPPS
jgi:hypothetical protein